MDFSRKYRRCDRCHYVEGETRMLVYGNGLAGRHVTYGLSEAWGFSPLRCYKDLCGRCSRIIDEHLAKLPKPEIRGPERPHGYDHGSCQLEPGSYLERNGEYVLTEDLIELERLRHEGRDE
jgi:hypothetical protein